MNKEFTLVQTRPWVIKFLASRNPGVVVLGSLPLLIFFTFQLEKQILVNLFLGLVGVIYWSFLEYAIHRWPYHMKYNSTKIRNFMDTFHMYHHRNLPDRRVLNAGPMMVYPMAFTILTPIYILMITFDFGFHDLSAFALGTLTAYVAYEFVHFFIHYREYKSGYMSYIQKYHFYHHEKKWNKNFGNTSHFWDVLLGTYDQKYKSYSLSEKARESLITAND